MTNPLSIENLCKSFDSKQVLDNITFDLREGEIFGLIGLNGIGKTTLIKIILGLLREDSGNINIFGEAWKTTAAKRYIAYLPEKFQPSRYLTGRECIELAHSYYNKTYNHANACEQAEMLGLDPDALNRRVASYSKGMGQKTGLISTLMVDTPLIILDEPMSGLDPMARIQLKSRLKQVKEEGRTIFFSSHILADIEEICDRIAILHDTEFRYYGDTTTFKDTYKEMTLEQAFLKVIGNTTHTHDIERAS